MFLFVTPDGSNHKLSRCFTEVLAEMTNPKLDQQIIDYSDNSVNIVDYSEPSLESFDTYHNSE